MKQLGVTLDDGVMEALDAVRGEESRASWVRGVIERALEGGGGGLERLERIEDRLRRLEEVAGI